MKYINIKLAGLFTLLFLSLTSASAAEWTVYPYYYPIPQKIVDTGNKVYYVAGNSLFSYDQETEESESYTSFNKLNDKEITTIFYNPEKKYLFILYSSGAVDLMYDDGSIYYLPELRDAEIDHNFTVNDVKFDGDYIYLATSFGIVKFNEARKEISSYGLYNKAVNNLAIIGERLIIMYGGTLYYTDKKNDLRSDKIFTKLFNRGTLKFLESWGEDILLYGYSSKPNAVNWLQIDFENNVMAKGGSLNPDATVVDYYKKDRDGNFIYIANNKVYKIDKDLNNEKLFEIASDYREGLSAIHDVSGQVWNLTGDGLMKYRSDGNGGITVEMERFRPEQLNTRNVMQFDYDAASKMLWIGNITPTSFKYNSANTQARLSPQTTSVYKIDEDRFVNVTPFPVTAHMEPALTQQKNYGKYILAASMFALDPDDKDTYYLASANDGLYKIKNGEVIGVFDSNNSPLASFWGCNAFGVKVDAAGNLWSASYSLDGTSGIHILPAAKRNKPVNQIMKSDWVSVVTDLFAGGLDFVFLEHKKQYMIMGTQGSSGKIMIYDNNKTPNNFNDDKISVVTSFIDQDGKVSSPVRMSCFAEDNNGRIWIGTEQGIFIVNDITSVSGSRLNVTKIKVPRNDGTNEADYLLGSDLVLDIAVDGSNRKWIATANSGLYQVNANGSEILQVFSGSNSPLYSNYVNAVEVLPGSNDLFVGTNEGLFRYNYDTEGSTEKLDELLIYPNPVKEDYIGPVTIKGLMDNTLVKIVDSAGNMVAQGRSENGQYRWNCQNIWGSKVPTGVYYVLVSENSSGTSTSSIGKIMVIN